MSHRVTRCCLAATNPFPVIAMSHCGAFGHPDHLTPYVYPRLTVPGFPFQLLFPLRSQARALGRILDKKYYGAAWPKTDRFGSVERWDHTHADDVNTGIHWDSIHQWSTIAAARTGTTTGHPISTAPADACDADAGTGCPGSAGSGTDGTDGTDPAAPRTGFDAVLGRLFRRIDTASGPYQMISVLGDGIVFRCPASSMHDSSSSIDATYIEEQPLDYFHHQVPASAPV